MGKEELAAVVDMLVLDSVSYNSEFMRENENYLKRYNQECYGDEEKGFSQVIASDVRDTVDSDMTSLVRVFLGSGNVIEFEPVTDDEAEVEEAKIKTEYINHLLLRRPKSYTVIHGFLKDADIQKMGVVHYFMDTERTTREELKKGLTLDEITLFVKEQKDKDESVKKIDIVEKEEDEGKFDVRFRFTVENEEFMLQGIQTEDFLITKNSSSLEDAQSVGHESYPTRSELVASGLSEEEVDKFPTASTKGNSSGNQQQSSGQSSNMKDIRWRDEGGNVTDSKAFSLWSAETVKKVLIFALVDFDGDGIAERRRIVKIGNTITENEPHDHIPYAITSCIIEPHKAIGNGRASLVIQDQSVNTELDRATLDNIYDVGNPRTILGKDVNTDDYYDSRKDGVVRMLPNSTSNPAEAAFPLTTPFVGQEILMVKQSRDQAQADRTGTLIASQGLEADQLHQETATRFSGVEKANEAKMELVARNHAEVGFRKLFEGAVWTLRRFQDKEVKVRVNGKAMVVNPADWKFPDVAKSQVGLGAGAGDKTVEQALGLLTIQQQLQATGSLLTDDQKIYNSLNKITPALGFSNTSEFFNNPDAPQELIFAQLQQMTAALQQAQLQIEQLSQSNPLAEAEQIKAQASLINAQSKTKVELIKTDAATTQKQLEMLQKTAFHDSDKTFDYTKLEVENGVDIPGKGVNG